MIMPLHQNQKHQNKDIVSHLVAKIQEDIQLDIEEGKIRIPRKKTQLPIQGKNQRQLSEQKHKLDILLERKQQVKKQMSQIMTQEMQIKHNKMVASRVNETNNKYFKSQLTQQDIEKLKKLKAQQAKFEEQLLQKTKKYQEKMNQIKQEERHAQQQIRKQKYELKKQQIQKTLQVIEKRKAQRINRIEQQKNALKQIANRKKIHEEWQQKWKLAEQEQEKKKEQLKQEIRKMKQINYEQIKQHQKKYQQIVKMQKSSRIRTSMVQLSPTNNYKSAFLECIKEQQQKSKQMEQHKRGLPKQYLNKLKQYGQKVKQLHKPTVKQRMKEEEKQQLKSLSLYQTHHKGNEYMRTVNQQLSQILKRKDANTSQPKVQEKKPIKYKDYLKQARKPNQSDQNSKTLSQLDHIRQIMNNENLSKQEKLQKAKFLTEKMERRKIVKSGGSLVKSINAKLQILKQLQI